MVTTEKSSSFRESLKLLDLIEQNQTPKEVSAVTAQEDDPEGIVFAIGSRGLGKSKWISRSGLPSGYFWNMDKIYD